ncbi:ribosomal protein-like [Striga asiatica]|uniref:Ribosomal protein-like n=1 Tax=Striga asiatica TaxID=4170 RepID=A0A5A7QKH9_STRAF|nr:ribosomal protein-like [Striga asiatica]
MDPKLDFKYGKENVGADPFRPSQVFHFRPAHVESTTSNFQFLNTQSLQLHLDVIFSRLEHKISSKEAPSIVVTERMTSEDSNSHSMGGSLSTESLSLTKGLFGDDNFDEDVESDVVQIGTVHVPFMISSFLTGRKRPHGGSTVGRAYIRRDRRDHHELVVNYYFKGDKSKYTPDKFRRRFRMDIELFERILQVVNNYDEYFTQKVDAVGNIGLSSLQKVVAAIRMLAYGCSADSLDEYVQIGESTAIECLKRNAWQPRLYALALEELSNCLAWCIY